MQPKVSVILPIYNVEKYLDRCMHSILNQTLQDIEVIMVDDGSPGRCPQMCDEYAEKDNRVKVIHQENAGAGLARTAGIKIATGEFMSFVDSDDYVELNMLEKMYTLARERNLEAVSCGIKNLNPDGSLKSLEYAYPEYHETNSEKECWEIATLTIGGEHRKKTNGVFVRHRPAVWRFLFRSDIIQRYNIEFPSEREVFSEDSIFNLKFLIHASRIGYIPDYLVYHCYNTDSLTATRKKLRDYKTYRNEYWMVHKLCGNPQYGLTLQRTAATFYLGIVNTHLSSIIAARQSINESLKLFRLVVNDRQTWKGVRDEINVGKLPFKRKLLAWTAYHKAAFLLYLIYYFNLKKG